MGPFFLLESMSDTKCQQTGSESSGGSENRCESHGNRSSGNLNYVTIGAIILVALFFMQFFYQQHALSSLKQEIEVNITALERHNSELQDKISKTNATAEVQVQACEMIDYKQFHKLISNNTMKAEKGNDLIALEAE